MARNGECISPSVKKALLERLGEKCPIDEDGCSEVLSVVERFPVCGIERKVRTRRVPVKVDVEVDEQEEVEDLPELPRGPRGAPVMVMPARREKRPYALSEYQRHMSACLLKEIPFSECISKWRKGESMASQYKGSGMTK